MTSSFHKILDDEYLHSDLESSESQQSESPKSINEIDYERGTDFEFKSDDDAESVSTKRSQLKIVRTAGGSRIRKMSFYDAKDINSARWKTVFPRKNMTQCHRVAAALSIFSKQTMDTEGNLVSGDLAAQVCELLLGDMDKDKALNSISPLYSIYQPEDKDSGYFRSARLELRKWYDRKASLTPETRRVRLSFSSDQLKRAFEQDPDTETPPPAKRTLHTIKPKSVAEAIQVQSSPQTVAFPVNPPISQLSRSFSDPRIQLPEPTPTENSSPISGPGGFADSPMKALGNLSSYLRC